MYLMNFQFVCFAMLCYLQLFSEKIENNEKKLIKHPFHQKTRN